jgi:hypothetical protein
MQTSLVIALTVAFVLAGGSALAVMNKSCKSGHGPWCAPVRTYCPRFGIGPPPSLPLSLPFCSDTLPLMAYSQKVPATPFALVRVHVVGMRRCDLKHIFAGFSFFALQMIASLSACCSMRGASTSRVQADIERARRQGRLATGWNIDRDLGPTVLPNGHLLLTRAKHWGEY